MCSDIIEGTSLLIPAPCPVPPAVMWPRGLLTLLTSFHVDMLRAGRHEGTLAHTHGGYLGLHLRRGLLEAYIVPFCE